ncbi:uncharacterized protein LOC135697602 [Ochlerotatus camptorhynchus]|uniref:uncharacterized protein LOC135697602 n=1 Tax=Ochlerotatus camptorhynchus TaxID=644619 RepID=UPI0031E24979
MTRTCMVRGCKSRVKPGMKTPSEVKFFRFPRIDRRTKTRETLSITRRKLWCKVLGVSESRRLDHYVVCSFHFRSGHSAELSEDWHTDWVPSLYLDPFSAASIQRNNHKNPPELITADPSRSRFDHSAPTLLLDDESDDSYEYDVTDMVKDPQLEPPEQTLVIEDKSGAQREAIIDLYAQPNEMFDE